MPKFFSSSSASSSATKKIIFSIFLFFVILGILLPQITHADSILGTAYDYWFGGGLTAEDVSLKTCPNNGVGYQVIL